MKLTTTQKRLIREYLKWSADIMSIEDIGAEGNIALDLLNEVIPYEIYIELIDIYIKEERAREQNE